jgi:hypothetical protein
MSDKLRRIFSGEHGPVIEVLIALVLLLGALTAGTAYLDGRVARGAHDALREPVARIAALETARDEARRDRVRLIRIERNVARIVCSTSPADCAAAMSAIGSE